MVFEEYLPYVGIVSLLIALGIIIYNVGKWKQKTDTDREEIIKKLEFIATKLEKIPDELFAKSVDAYKFYEKIKEDLKPNKKEENEE
jgi:hypothetical protein